jgi:hypothetical protein
VNVITVNKIVWLAMKTDCVLIVVKDTEIIMAVAFCVKMDTSLMEE